jgi:hypothetical protein
MEAIRLSFGRIVKRSVSAGNEMRHLPRIEMSAQHLRLALTGSRRDEVEHRLRFRR